MSAFQQTLIMAQSIPTVYQLDTTKQQIMDNCLTTSKYASSWPTTSLSSAPLLALPPPLSISVPLLSSTLSTTSSPGMQLPSASVSSDQGTASPSGSASGEDRSSPRVARVRRGRPQQDIEDEEGDPSSERRKHRRLYARQYRAQMRNKIEEVSKLKDSTDELKKKHKEEVDQLNQTIINLVQLNQQLIYFLQANPQVPNLRM